VAQVTREVCKAYQAEAFSYGRSVDTSTSLFIVGRYVVYEWTSVVRYRHTVTSCVLQKMLPGCSADGNAACMVTFLARVLCVSSWWTTGLEGCAATRLYS
jgi:hypothetical protein